MGRIRLAQACKACERWPRARSRSVAWRSTICRRPLVDSDHETIELRNGGQSIKTLSIGEYGSRRGIARITEILEKANVPASFFVPAVSALLHPEQHGYAMTRFILGWIDFLGFGLTRRHEVSLTSSSTNSTLRARSAASSS
jgi:hypothetical protein